MLRLDPILGDLDSQKMLIVATPKGGVGKSAIAASLAVYLDAVALDLDYQKGVALFNRANTFANASLDALRKEIAQ